MAKMASELIARLKFLDEDISYHKEELQGLLGRRMALFPELKAAFLAAEDRPIYYQGKLYRAAWRNGEMVEVIASEVTIASDLAIPEPEGVATILLAGLEAAAGLGLPAPDPEGDTVAELDGEPDLSFVVCPPDRIERPAGEDPAFRYESENTSA